ncbi:uncharacterized protein [Primulina eburnea]|uniref:uncharacterized protein n=1 Tax=Primulina eburnea TaxID=1245227 RepID=UPI003C6C2C37
MGEADAEPENVMTELQTKELRQQCGESDSEEDPEEDKENGLCEEISEDPENVMNEEPEEAASEVEIYEESDEYPGNTMVEVSEDDPEEEINEENDCDLEDEADGEPEDDPEEEINEENDCDLEDEVHEEPGENLEEEIYEEPEEESEEEIVEDLGYGPEEEMDEEPEEESEEEIVEDQEDDPEEEIDKESDEEQAVENSNLSLLRGGSADVKGLGHKLNDSADGESRNKMVAIKTSGPILSTVTPSELHQSNNVTKHVQHSSRLGKMTLEGCKSQKMIQNEENLKSESNGTFATSEFDGKIGLLSVTVNDDCASRQQEPGTSSRKHRQSRWDLRAEEETPLLAGTGKRRKTRWDNDDSRNFLFQVSSSLELSTNQEVLRLKESLMEINKMLQYKCTCTEETQEKSTKILSQLATRLSCQSPYPFTEKIFVPVGEYPTYKFIGLILGPKGNTQKRMEKETGAKIRLRGKGFGDHSEAEELHVLVEADNQRALNAAKAMVEKLLIPVADENNEHKKAQLTELAKMRGTYKDQNTCQLCKEQGHIQYACPLKDSSFNAACCDTCGGFDHPTSKCKSNEKSNKEVDNSTLYVGYLSQVTDEKRLKELFLPFGKIIKAAVIKDPMTGLSKGYGFVEFDKSTDASAAVTYMNGYKMAGKVLAVRIAGQKPVAAPPPTPVPSVIYGQTGGIYGREPSMFPGAQVSFSTSESSYFPYSSGTVARTVGSTIPPYAATSIIYPRMNNNDVFSREFSCQIPSSFSNSAISHFHGNPDTGSQFKSYITSSQFNPYITNPAMDEFRTFSQITETKDKPNYGQGYRLS